jgi:hypothetical protein
MLKRILAGVILALILTGGAVAGPFEEGDAAYQRATMRVRLWRPLAEQGNATAQFRGPAGRCRGSQVVSSPRRVGAPGRPPLEEESPAWVPVPLPFLHWPHSSECARWQRTAIPLAQKEVGIPSGDHFGFTAGVYCYQSDVDINEESQAVWATA